MGILKAASGKKNLRPCVIGIDPGLANTGYGIISFSNNRFECIEYGSISTEPHLLQGMRLLKIFDRVSALIEKYRPKEAGIETLYFAKNATSAMSVSEARGVVLLALAQGGVRVGEYAPNSIKKAVTGIAQAEKRQVQEAVKLILGLKEIPRPDHAADALAAAITKINLGDVGEVRAYV
ncbi:crossover junction endodeoxyribonuclease RuvC [Treponema denticola]|uniref:crossover junction endodeoxyribonuclease RuvC n=1 Tax=Treponema denticola TaxID=158 RepID=UPI0026ECE81D|nr:crossover junction endodeoxyribonuclease RuvC [Treponema denticola]